MARPSIGPENTALSFNGGMTNVFENSKPRLLFYLVTVSFPKYKAERGHKASPSDCEPCGLTHNTSCVAGTLIRN